MQIAPPAWVDRLVERGATLVAPPVSALPRRPVDDLLDAALARPVDAPRLSAITSASSRVAIVVSDATRDEPRDELVAAARAAMPDVPDDHVTLVIASGTHAPRPPETALSKVLLSRYRIVVHDGSSLASCDDRGTTSRGTRVRINRALCEADVVISTGRIRPHYFAGYSGGAKGIFPGCAHGPDARQNHLMKALPEARLGRLDDNACRLDLEEAALLLPGKTYLLNVVADVDGVHVGAFAGHLVNAHREACNLARGLFVARSSARARVTISVDVPPVTSSLYQASKMLPPVGPLLEPHGTAIMVAGCEEGIGPVQTVNEGIYQLGVRHHLPEGHRVRLVSTMSPDEVAKSYATHAPSVDAALAEAGFAEGARLDDVVVLWRAGELIVEAIA